jgi:hypothetical protein
MASAEFVNSIHTIEEMHKVSEFIEQMKQKWLCHLYGKVAL